MTGFAHVGGIPVEETLGAFTPALLATFGAASATLRGRLRRARSRATPTARRPTTSADPGKDAHDDARRHRRASA